MRKSLLFTVIVVLLILFSFFLQSFQKGTSKAMYKLAFKVSTDTTSKLVNDTSYLYANRSNLHLPFGFPIDSDTTDDYILEKRQYVLSYCEKKNVANWVAWQLNHSWLGDESRYSGNFISDATLPRHFYSVTHSTYTNSGFDRGHIVRSKERTLNEEDNRATFLLTNIIPQTPDLNRGVWLRFEDYYLNKVEKENLNMYIVSGGFFSQNFKTLHDRGHVAIPDTCFKIVLITKHIALNDTMLIKDFQTIAVAMPNTEGVRNNPWEQYITTISAIEQSTAYDFFVLLPDSIKDAVKHKKYVKK